MFVIKSMKYVLKYVMDFFFMLVCFAAFLVSVLSYLSYNGKLRAIWAVFELLLVLFAPYKYN